MECKCSSLNDGDVFILELVDTIMQWNGREANRMEKAKALEIVSKTKGMI